MATPTVQLTPLESRWMSLLHQAMKQLGTNPDAPYLYFSRISIKPDSVHADAVSTSILIEDSPDGPAPRRPRRADNRAT